MKTKKRLFPMLLTLVLGAGLAMPLFACGETEKTDGDKNGTNANMISASLLDGKVANLLSASGIAIQDKTQNGDTMSASKQKNARKIVASADETTIEQPETELVKQTGEGVQDVHFYDGEKGSYTEWNEETHHHDGQVCEVEGCMDVSDETLAQEVEVPTVISLDARVNKLYNSGKFTFMCVSSAVEGRVQLFTQVSKTPISLSLQFFMETGAYPYVDGHYLSETNRSLSISYMNVQAGDKKGKILVRRSAAEEAYHYANYWSDDFNQSYIIDNETGKTYSLSALPYIYSVQNGVIVTKTDKSEKVYIPQIDKNGDLRLNEIEIPQQYQTTYTSSAYLADKYGNLVFRGYEFPHEGVVTDIYGERREGKFIFTGLNQELYTMLQHSQDKGGQFKQQAYARAKRYMIGSDGQIYRFDFRGDFRSVPVHVLNAQGEWVDVPQDTHVKFSAKDSFFVEASINVANQQYIILTQIKDGKTYFANAAYGADLPFTRNNYPLEYAQINYFVGVTAIPTDGNPDTSMQDFMQNVKDTGVLDNDSIVYRVGDTAFAYEDKSKGEIVIWDRETETRKSIAVGEPINNNTSGWHIFWTDPWKYTAACFQVNTVNGAYYVSYDEKNPTKKWSEYSTIPFEKEEELDAYFELLTNKLRR